MPVPVRLDLSRRALIAVLLVLVLILVLQAWAVIAMRRHGYDEAHAHNLSRLAGLPLLFLLAWRILLRDGQMPARLFAATLDVRLVGTAVALGVILRIAEWAMLTARGALGFVPDALAAGPVPFSLGWQCPPPDVLVVGVLAWWLLVPVTEEFIHRGIVQSALANGGKARAIAVATTVFTLAHPPAAWASVFAIGLLFGLLYWNSGVLWYPVIAHAAYDGMIPFDSLCLRLGWNPAAADLPVTAVAVPAVFIVALSAAASFWLVSSRWIGRTRTRPT
ncbi:MAG TPA: CPBP family intramembrane glutamic endopeptidase [Woeseiaceae bacterium]|nr:CPBP family intramembrane glutamic endopeptidase [Woeseiaceae bacterium]